MKPLRHRQSASRSALPERPPWTDLDDRGAGELLAEAQPASLDRGAHVKTAPGIVLDGVVGFERALSDGRRVLADLFHEGDLINFGGSERVREGRLVALTDSRLFTFEDGWIEQCIAGYAPIGPVVDAQLKRHHARLHDHITDLAAKTPLEKVASVLFEFRRWPEGETASEHQPVIRIPIRRADIADYLGMKPETLSRAVRCLEQDGLIRPLAADHIRIVNIVGMRRIANGGRPRRSTRQV